MILISLGSCGFKNVSEDATKRPEDDTHEFGSHEGRRSLRETVYGTESVCVGGLRDGDKIRFVVRCKTVQVIDAPDSYAFVSASIIDLLIILTRPDKILRGY